MRILYLCQYFTRPDEPGGGRAYGFARRWAEQGHEVTVLTSAVNYKLASVYPECRGRWITRSEVDGVRLHRLWTPAGFRGSMRRRIPYFLGFAASATLAGLCMRRRPHVIFATSTPLTVGIPGWFLSRWWRRPLVFEVRDPWPEAAVAAGVLRPGLLVTAADRFARFIYRQARAVITVSKGYAELIASTGVEHGKIHIIPNGAEPWILERAVLPATRTPAPPAPFRCVYAGGLGRWNGVATIVAAAAELKDDPSIRVVIIGDGDERATLEETARRQGLGNVEFTGALSKREAMHRVAEADVCLLPGLDRSFYRRILQNKMFDYLAAGRPIVVTSPGEAADLLVSAGAAVAAPPEDPAALGAAIRRMRAMSAGERQAMGLRGRTLAESRYRRVSLADEALGVLKGAAPVNGSTTRAKRVPGARLWLGAAAVAALIAIAYSTTFRTLWRMWAHNETYSHGILIPLVSGFMLWLRRDRLSRAPVEPSHWGLPLITAGLLLQMAGVRGDLTILQGHSFILVLLGLILHFFGNAIVRLTLFPVAYLVFMSPFPPLVVDEISFHLKIWAINFALLTVGWMGVPVVREGMMLHLPTGAVSIEDPCSGLRSLIALLALATLMAAFAHGSAVKRALLVLSAVPAALAANLMRISLIVLASNYLGVEAGTGVVHDVSGYLLFIVGILGLLGSRSLLRC